MKSKNSRKYGKYSDYQIVYTWFSSKVKYISHYDKNKINVVYHDGNRYTYYGVGKVTWAKIKSIVDGDELELFLIKIPTRIRVRQRFYQYEKNLNKAVQQGGQNV